MLLPFPGRVHAPAPTGLRCRRDTLTEKQADAAWAFYIEHEDLIRKLAYRLGPKQARRDRAMWDEYLEEA